MMSVFRSFSLSLSNSPGTIYLHDSRRCRGVVCGEGVLVKDVDQVCRCLEPPVPPVARIFLPYVTQEQDFVSIPTRHLHPVKPEGSTNSVSTAVWMVAIDIAKEATAKREGFEDSTNQSDMLKFMPAKMKEKMGDIGAGPITQSALGSCNFLPFRHQLYTMASRSY